MSIAATAATPHTMDNKKIDSRKRRRIDDDEDDNDSEASNDVDRRIIDVDEDDDDSKDDDDNNDDDYDEDEDDDDEASNDVDDDSSSRALVLSIMPPSSVGSGRCAPGTSMLCSTASSRRGGGRGPWRSFGEIAALVGLATTTTLATGVCRRRSGKNDGREGPPLHRRRVPRP